MAPNLDVAHSNQQDHSEVAFKFADLITHIMNSFQSIIDPGWLLYTMLAVEFTIAFNNIVDVNNILTAGQMIALVVSFGGCFAVLMAIWTTNREKHFHLE